MKCKYEGTGIWAGRCIGTKEVDPCPGYDKCKEYKPDYMTNADRIRSMSDEELADFLDEVQEEECNALHEVRQDGTLKFMSLRNGWLEWLKQPVEAVADYLLDNGVTVQQWIPVTERLPDEYVSVLGHMTDTDSFPSVRECFLIGNEFWFPALLTTWPVDRWAELPEG